MLEIVRQSVLSILSVGIGNLHILYLYYDFIFIIYIIIIIIRIDKYVYKHNIFQMPILYN